MMIGTALQNRYKVEKKVGQGGSATVYRGFDIELKRPVAIKVLERVEGAGDFTTRFKKEAEAMARLNHPNIVTVHDFADHEGRPYFIMEFVEGPTLIEMADRSVFSLSAVYSAAREICRGMTAAHSHGVIHGDLTLKNVVVLEGAEDGPRIKILDFGLARLLHDQAAAAGDSLSGTPYYLAPEQIKHEAIDGRTDVYAFGVGLYRLVNGRYPFTAQHPAALLYVILNQKKFICADGVPEALHSLIVRCLEKNPNNRPKDFTDLAAELAEIEAGLKPDEGGTPESLSELSAVPRSRDKENPYLNRVMIKDPEEFIGREAEVRRIYSRLDAARPQSVSVVGERKIGKSSLLNFVYHRANRREFMRNCEDSVFVYLDFQSKLEYDIEMFIDFLFNMFSFECADGHDYTERDKSLDQLGEVIAELDSEGKRIVILMDEFEVITRNKRFDESFFAFLRSLANSYKVAYVTSSCEDLQEMCHNQDIADSPFFNIFSNLPLRSFERAEARELITAPSERAGVPLEAYADRILDMAGCFPLFLQVACAAAFDFLADNESSDPDWEKISQLFTEEIDPYFRSVWLRFDESSRENIIQIARKKSSGKKYINTKLLRRGYLAESDEEMRIFASSFREFVLAESERTGESRGLLGKIFGPRRFGNR
jgi:AAA+ ATPase superfamily predicted ATPase